MQTTITTFEQHREGWERAVKRHGGFGVSFSGVFETGGLIVSDKLRITLHIEAVRPA